MERRLVDSSSLFFYSFLFGLFFFLGPCEIFLAELPHPSTIRSVQFFWTLCGDLF